MRLRGSLLRLPAILCVILLGLDAYAFHEGIPVVTLFPDEPPVNATFYFSGGGPLDRFTSRPDAWYALYRLPLRPNHACAVLINHENEPEKVRVFALDRNPFDAAVQMKFELRMARIDWQPFFVHGPRTYEAIIGLPPDSAVPGIYLLVEMTPQGPAERLRPLLFQVLDASNTYMERRRPYTRWWAWDNNASFRNQRPVVLPVPRIRDARTNANW